MEIKSKLFIKNSQSHFELNSLYAFYKSIWSTTLEQLNSSKTNLVRDFNRFDIKLGFFSEGMPVAFQGYQYFDLNLEAHREHPYFHQLNVPLVDVLLKKGIVSVATSEYMCVCPQYRKNGNRKIGEILGGFSAQFFTDEKIDAMITISRNGRGVNRMCKMYGAEPLFEDLKLHNVEVDVMLFKPKNIKKNPDLSLQNTIEQLLVMSKTDQLTMNGVAA